MVPLLVIIPSLTQPPEKLAMLLGVALVKAVIVLAVILVFGQKLMRKWFHFVARAKSSEVFVLNVLLITLSLATITELAGLSLALGAFVAGMLISETEYKMPVVAGPAGLASLVADQVADYRVDFFAPGRFARQCHSFGLVAVCRW